jgi:hypothetical protein
VAYVKLYRISNTTGDETHLGRFSSSVHQWTDVVALSGGATSDGDYINYELFSYDASGNYLGVADSVDILPGAWDDTAGSLTYHGTWHRTAQRGATLGHYSYSSSAGGSVKFHSCYYNLGLVGTTGPNGGTAKVVVNGTVLTTISFYSSSVQKRVVLWKQSYPAYPYQCNTVKIVPEDRPD